MLSQLLSNFIIIILLMVTNCKEIVEMEDICDRIKFDISKLHLQALTTDHKHLYLIETNLLYIIHWRQVNTTTDKLTIGYSRNNSIRWDEVPWLRKSINKLKNGVHQLAYELILFQMIPCLNSNQCQPNSTLHHMIIENTLNRQNEHLYWYEKVDRSIWYYSRSKLSHIPKHYHLISDGHNRSYVFTLSNELEGNSNIDNPVLIILPDRDITTPYWFVLKMDQSKTNLEFALQGKSDFMTYQTTNDTTTFVNQLPFGFIYQHKVYLLFENLVYIFPFVDLSNKYTILNFNGRSFHPIVPLIVKRLNQFIQCSPIRAARSVDANMAMTLESESTTRNVTSETLSSNDTRIKLYYPNEIRTITIIWVLLIIYMVIILAISVRIFLKEPYNVISEQCELPTMSPKRNANSYTSITILSKTITTNSTSSQNNVNSR